MTMDELLTRMLEVEKEADVIVSKAKDAAHELLVETHREVAEIEAAAKKEDAKAAEVAIADAVAKAEADRARRLKEAEVEQCRRAEELRERLEAKKQLVVEGLMGHLWKI